MNNYAQKFTQMHFRIKILFWNFHRYFNSALPTTTWDICLLGIVTCPVSGYRRHLHFSIPIYHFRLTVSLPSESQGNSLGNRLKFAIAIESHSVSDFNSNATHWKPTVVMMPTLLSLAVPKLFVMATCCAISGHQVSSCSSKLTHWGRDNIDAILQTTFSNAIS